MDRLLCVCVGVLARASLIPGMAGSGRTGDLPASHLRYGSVGGGYNDFRSCGRPLGLPIPYLRMQIGEGKGLQNVLEISNNFWKS